MSLGFQRLDDMQEEGVVTAAGRWYRGEVVPEAPAAEDILLFRGFAPALHREGRICDHIVEGLQGGIILLVERVVEGIAVAQLSIVHAVDNHRHTRHTDGGKVFLLAINTHVVLGLSLGAKQQRAGAAGGVVDGNHLALVLADANHFGHDAAHLGRRIELALALTGFGSKVLH